MPERVGRNQATHLTPSGRNSHAVPHFGPHRRAGQHPRARRDELRRARAHHPGRGHRDRRRRPGGRDQPHRHRRHVQRRASRRRWSARPSPAAATTSCWPRRRGMPMGDERNHRGSSRRWLVTELDNSLRRLGVDHVDLYQIHRWDPTTSDEETLSALTDLQRAGKIRYFGSSTFPAYRIVQAAVGRPGAPPEPLRHRAAQLLDPAARNRGPRPARDRAVRARRAGLEPAGLGLAVRRDPRGPGDHHQPLGAPARSASTSASRPTRPGSTPSSGWPPSPTRPG